MCSAVNCAGSTVETPFDARSEDDNHYPSSCKHTLESPTSGDDDVFVGVSDGHCETSTTDASKHGHGLGSARQSRQFPDKRPRLLLGPFDPD
jgi:hypothetical protein